MRPAHLGGFESRVRSETALTVLCGYRKHSPASSVVGVRSPRGFTNGSRRELSIKLSFTGHGLRSQAVPLQSVK